jgi:hypothetical protein
MSTEDKDAGTSHKVENRAGSVTEIRQVQNVALADATAKAGVSPWTPAMFKVSSEMYASILTRILHATVVPMSAHRNTKLLHQRIRWLAHGRN